MQKNVTGQQWYVYAFDSTTNLPQTGDAANITANLYLDGGTANAVDDTNPTEVAHGYYRFDLTQAETNANHILIDPVSGTSNILVVGLPGSVYTTPPYFSTLGIASDGDLVKVNTLDGHTPQTADHTSAIATVQADLDILTGSDGVTLATAQGNYAPAKAGDLMGLVNDAITSAKFDESTAYPLKSADTGSTQLARTGADSDTLETLSDQIDGVSSGGGASAADIADAVWNEDTTDHVTAGSFGKAVGDISDDVLGPGDYAVTLTIRTTGGVAVSGVSVWVNSSNDRTGSVAGSKVTSASGQVTFNLAYGTYYVFCSLSGYTFAAASFTAAAGFVSFTKDIAAATSAGSSAFYADSFLTRGIADVREALDEPSVSAKYTDARIIEHLEKAYILVLNEKNRQDKTPAVVKQDLTIAANTTTYMLPYTMGSFLGLYSENESGGKVYYDGNSRFNPYGQRVWLEGHTLHVQSTDMFGIGTALKMEWIPSGIARLHNGTCSVSADGLTVTLGATPNSGTLDTHDNAYSGGVLRILGVSGTTAAGNYLQERNITAYDNTTRAATLDVALDPLPTTDDGYIYYEIAPAIHKGMDMVVALYAAYRIMTVEGNQKRTNGILSAYRNEIRNVRLSTYYSNIPESPRLRGDCFDNNRYR